MNLIDILSVWMTKLVFEEVPICQFFQNCFLGLKITFHISNNKQTLNSCLAFWCCLDGSWFCRTAINSSLFKQWLRNLQSETGILADNAMSLKRVLIQVAILIQIHTHIGM